MLKKEFFNRSAETVARELLNKIIVRKISNEKELKARIVETEAYFDEKDPASRARQKGDLRETMKMNPGTILVYGVHANWLMNIVTDEEGEASAVLMRAVEPLNFEGNCSGPGLLTRALKIGKEFHKRNILNDKEIWIEDFFDERNIGSNISNSEREKSRASEPSSEESIKLPITKITNLNNIIPSNLESKNKNIIKSKQVSESTLAKEVLMSKDNELIANNKNNFEITESFRIGVKKDLPRKLRFYIKNSPYISRL